MEEEKLVNRNESLNNKKINIIDIAAILWKRKILVIVIILISIIGSLIYTIGSIILPPEKSYLPNLYTSKATLIIQTSNSNNNLSSVLAASSMSSLAGIAGIGISGNTNGALAEVIATNNTTLDIIDKKFEIGKNLSTKKKKKLLQTDIRKEIKRRLSAKLDVKTNVFTVSYFDKDPLIAKNIVDELVNILEERFASLDGDKSILKRDLLEKKLIDVDNSIIELESKVKAFQNKYGVIQVEALATEQITIMARLRSELILKEMEIRNYENISRSNDPILVQLKNERDALLEKIKEIETGIGTGSRIMPSQKELPSIAFEYARLQRDLLVQAELFKILTQQYELAKLSVAGQEPIFQILETAEISDKKSAPSRSMICIIATFAGIFSSIFVTIIIEIFEKVKNDPETINRFKAISSKKVE